MEKSTDNNSSGCKIIFNHMPKTGGTSMHQFFEEVFGKDRVYRFRNRLITPDTLTIEKMSDTQRQYFKVFQGHFPYGYRSMIGKHAFYFGIIRDPIDRIVSDYYYNKRKGRKDRKEYARSVPLGKYVKRYIKQKGTGIGSHQTYFLTKTRDTEAARRVFEEEYFLVCTTDQLYKCQEMLSLAFLDSDSKSVHRNTTEYSEKQARVREKIKAAHREIFDVDYETLTWVESHFTQIYNNKEEWARHTRQRFFRFIERP